MARSKLISNLDNTKPIYVGLDVHKTKWSVCIIHQDEIIENHTIPVEYNSLKPILRKYKSFKVFSAYEAGFMGFYLHRYLEKDNINNIIISPNKIPIESGNYVKTDKRDAQKISFSLSKGLIKGNYIPSIELVDLRQILRTRERVVKSRTRTINRIKMLLHQYEIKFINTGLTKLKLKELRKIELPENTKYSLNIYLDQLELYTKQSSDLAKRAHLMANKSIFSNTYNIIKTVPGIGPIIGALICFEIGDFKRFSSGKKLAAHIGLTPREFSSGEHIYKGRITGQGNSLLRSYLIEASWFLIGKDPAMKKYYNNHLKCLNHQECYSNPLSVSYKTFIK